MLSPNYYQFNFEMFQTVLENHLRRYPCLSLDDNLEIENDGVVVSVTVTTLEPADAVSIVDVDLNIDIEVNTVLGSFSNPIPSYNSKNKANRSSTHI
jgi:hypothetical protein